MAEKTTYTHQMGPEQAKLLKAKLEEQGFEFVVRPYTQFAAKKGKLNVTVYEKGPKVLVQGKGTEDFITFTLEPEILGVAEIGYEEVLHPDHFEPHFGIDESGKGDFFGPLVIAGCYVDGDVARKLEAAGVMDSKRIGSDAKIFSLADKIREIPGAIHEVIVIAPPRYNELYAQFGNLNKLLAWGHARTIENLAERKPDCPRALSDQFANPRVLQASMMERGKQLELVQRTKAESDPAVAAASVLAREAFVRWLDEKSAEVGVPLQKGASHLVIEAAQKIATISGRESLQGLAKTHFKTFLQISE